MSFVHLLNHSDYSMLRSSISIKKLIGAASGQAREGAVFEDRRNLRREKGDDKELLQTGKPFSHAIALTDIGNMFGALDFYFSALNNKKGKIKPILGCELRVFPPAGERETEVDTVVFLAENDLGYHNLIDLVSQGYLADYKIEPQIPFEALQQRSSGLIALYGGRRSALGSMLLSGKNGAAESRVSALRQIFGRDHLFLMLQNHGTAEEETVVRKTAALAERLDVQLVVTNDNHYAEADDWTAWKALRCIGLRKKMADYQEEWPGSLHIRSSEEMEELFRSYPDALSNTVAIANRCDVLIETDVGYKFWPVFPIPEGFDNPDDYLAHLTWERAPRVYPEMNEEQRDRLTFELDMMKTMHVASYMLIVQDFISWARENGVPVGPGRGSAAGSAVAYVLGITNIDPLRFGLLFERFLNPQRVSMPDIDTDFSDLGRFKVIAYVAEKYGRDCVGQIITYGRLKAKQVLKDVGAVMGLDYKELNEYTKKIPNLASGLAVPRGGKKKPNEVYADEIPEVIDTFIKTSDPRNREVWKYALKLEGLARQASIHAAGIIIAPQPLWTLAPLFRAPGESTPAIQYDKKFMEEIGFLKMDFLGLRNLSVISTAVEMVRTGKGVEIDIDRIDLTDSATYELLGRGITTGVFQFESDGMRNYLRKLRPNCIEDLIAMNALYRPGPLQFIPQYIRRKNGEEEVDCYHPDLEPILGETYGVIVYQEQVMQIAQLLSGFSLGEADKLRRAMSKKKGLENYEKTFIGGAVSRGYDEQLARRLWDVLIPFSEYAFNKSHAAAYSYVAFQTAWLKTHYVSEFMAANMTTEINDNDRVAQLVQESRSLGLSIIPPDINRNLAQFSVLDGKINYGLAGIRYVGLPAAEAIVHERHLNGPYLSLFDLTRRLADQPLVKKRQVESLVMAGALDGLIGTRAEQFASIGLAVDRGNSHLEEERRGQINLFAEEGATNAPAADPPLESAPPWSSMELLAKEREVLGCYISSHPLEMYRRELNDFTSSTLAPDQLSRLPISDQRWSLSSDGRRRTRQRIPVVLGGLISEMRSRMGADSTRPHGIGVLEDQFGKIDVIFWADAYSAVQEKVGKEEIVLIEGFLTPQRGRNGGDEGETPQLIGERVWPLDSAMEVLTKKLHLQLDLRSINEAALTEISELLEDWETEEHESVELYLHVISSDGKVRHTLADQKHRVKATRPLIEALTPLLGGAEQIALKR